MVPVGWQLGAAVWVYSLAWFFINDRVKLLAYHVFDSSKHGLLTPARVTEG